MMKTPVAAPWLPSSASGLWTWGRYQTGQWEDTAKTNPATGTDPVGAWADASGNSRDLLQATAGNRPVLNSGAVDFVSSDVLATSGTISLKPCTFFCLINFDNLTGNRRILASETSANLSIDTNGTTLRALKQDAVLLGSSSTAMSTGSWTRIIFTYDSSGNYAFYVNGSSAGTGTNNQTLPAGNVAIGGFSVFLDGKIKDCGLYNVVLSAGNITNLDTYLASL